MGAAVFFVRGWCGATGTYDEYVLASQYRAMEMDFNDLKSRFCEHHATPGAVAPGCPECSRAAPSPAQPSVRHDQHEDDGKELTEQEIDELEKCGKPTVELRRVPPAVDGNELPDEPGPWFRQSEVLNAWLIYREDDQLRGAIIGKQGHIFYMDLPRGGWSKAVHESIYAKQADELSAVKAEVDRLLGKLAEADEMYMQIDAERERLKRELAAYHAVREAVSVAKEQGRLRPHLTAADAERRLARMREILGPKLKDCEADWAKEVRELLGEGM